MEGVRDHDRRARRRHNRALLRVEAGGLVAAEVVGVGLLVLKVLAGVAALVERAKLRAHVRLNDAELVAAQVRALLVDRQHAAGVDRCLLKAQWKARHSPAGHKTASQSQGDATALHLIINQINQKTISICVPSGSCYQATTETLLRLHLPLNDEV